MTPAVIHALEQLASLQFRAEVDSMSSRRAVLLRLQEHPIVCSLAAHLAFSPTAVGAVLRAMENIASRPQELHVVHDDDATLAACAVAVLIAHGFLRPVIEEIIHRAGRTMWFTHVLAEHRDRPTDWPSIQLRPCASSQGRTISATVTQGHASLGAVDVRTTSGTTRIAA